MARDGLDLKNFHLFRNTSGNTFEGNHIVLSSPLFHHDGMPNGEIKILDLGRIKP